MGQVKVRSGLFWISSTDECNPISIFETDGLESALSVKRAVNSDNMELTTLVGKTNLVDSLNKSLSCGVGYYLSSTKINYELPSSTFGNIRIDNGRLIENYFEIFSIFGLTGHYKFANGEYTMTSFFKNKRPTYTKKDNSWKIWWNAQENKWTLTSTSTNSFSESTNIPLLGDDEFAHACTWSGNNQTGYSSHKVLKFEITELKEEYASANGIYYLRKIFVDDHPTFKQKDNNWMIWWDTDEDRWKLALYADDKFSSSYQKELFNLSFDVTAGRWTTTDSDFHAGKGPNSEPEPTPTPTATATPTFTPTPTPTYTLPYHEVTQIATGKNFSLILRRNGQVEVTGENTYGNLATGDKVTSNRLRTAKISNVKEVAAGTNHSLFLKETGEVFACGRNKYGQLGDGTTSDKITPVKITDNAKSIACQSQSSFIVKNDGKLYAFGFNENGELGNSSFKSANTPTEIKGDFKLPNQIRRLSPDETKTENGVVKVKDLVTENYFTINGDTLKTDSEKGNVFDFRTNKNYISLGDVHNDIFSSGTFAISFWGYLRSYSSTSNTRSVGMIASKWYSSDRNWERNSFIIYANGVFYSAKNNNNTSILQPNGSRFNPPLNTWYHLVYSVNKGKLSVYFNGKKMDTFAPDRIFEFSSNTNQSLSIGNLHHNKLYSLNGMIDDFRIFDKHLSETDAKSLYLSENTEEQTTNLPSIKKVTSGDTHTFLISDEDELWGFGRNEKGQLGDGNTDNVLIPKKILDQKVEKVEAGSFHSIVLDQNGNVFGTGANNFGQLGLSNLPQIKKFTNINKPDTKDIALGSQHSLLVDKKGNLLATGLNKDGQLGVGDSENKSVFARSSLDKVNKVFAGSDSSFYIVRDGVVLGSGDNTKSQFADGTSEDRYTPVEVGVVLPPTPTETATPTPTQTYDPYDTSIVCDLKLSFRYKEEGSTFVGSEIKFKVNVSSTTKKIKKILVSSQNNKINNAVVTHLELSTSGSSPIAISLLSTEVKKVDENYVLYGEIEIPPITSKCEFAEGYGNPRILQKIVPNDLPNRNTFFGESVALTNDYAFIGAPGNNVKSEENVGSIYIFKRQKEND